MVFNAFLMKTVVFCFGKVHSLLAVWDMLKQKCFRDPRFGLFKRQYHSPNIGRYLNIFTFNIDMHTTKRFTHYTATNEF